MGVVNSLQIGHWCSHVSFLEDRINVVVIHWGLITQCISHQRSCLQIHPVLLAECSTLITGRASVDGHALVALTHASPEECMSAPQCTPSMSSVFMSFHTDSHNQSLLYVTSRLKKGVPDCTQLIIEPV